MKILCDVCEAAAAKVFCAADEAALCLACDEKVHGCNKLASRHVRLELAESKPISKCDICESAPAFFYCGVDGTSLCLQCDLEVHIGGKKAHERYLLMAQRVEVGTHVAAELPKAAAEGDGAGHMKGPDRARPLKNGHHGPGEFHKGDSPRAGQERRPPSSTAATAPGRESLAAAKDRQRSVAKAMSDAPAVAIALGDEVEGGMAVETPGDGAACDVMRESPGIGPANERAPGGESPQEGNARRGKEDLPGFDLNTRPKRSPQLLLQGGEAQESEDMRTDGSGNTLNMERMQLEKKTKT